jgi:hypothetical protein
LAALGRFWPVCRASVVLTAALGLFGPQASPADDLALRRQQIANMSLSEQQQLLRSQQRFNELSAADQERMRTLHADLKADPNQARLQQVLERYHEWLKTLSPEQRAELEGLAAEARIKRIRELMTRQREEHNRRRPRFGGPSLPKEDQQAIYSWFSDLVWQHRREILAEIPEARREQVERLDEAMQRKALLFTAVQRGRADRFLIEPADYERLLTELTPETRDKLARAPSPQQKKRLARDWISQAIMARMGSYSMRRAMASISGDELQTTFESLPEAERQRLMRMPRDQMQEELKHLLMQRESRPDGPPPFDRPPMGSFGPPDHGRPGWERHPGGPPRGPRGRSEGDLRDFPRPDPPGDRPPALDGANGHPERGPKDRG